MLRPYGIDCSENTWMPRGEYDGKYLLAKHYRGAPAPVNDVSMDRWTPEEISAHALLGSSGPVSSSTVRHCRRRARLFGTTARGRPPVTDGLFAESKDGDRRLDGDRRRELRSGA